MKLVINSESSVASNLINDLSRIRKPPLPNMNNYMSLIVAYRDPGDGSRKAQLDIFYNKCKYY